MSVATRQFDTDVRTAELRYQALQIDATLRRMTLAQVLEFFGGDLAAWPSAAGFRTAVASIKRWHELQEGVGE
jgi:hypothetical protein